MPTETTGTTPCQFPLPPGDYTVTAAKEGYPDQTETLTVVANQTTTHNFVFDADEPGTQLPTDPVETASDKTMLIAVVAAVAIGLVLLKRD